jgi:hypothetical protein
MLSIGREGDVLQTAAFGIGALRGAPTAAIQRLMLVFAENRRREGIRVAGAIQVYDAAAGGDAKDTVLRDLVSGETFPVFQSLGKDSTGCSVDPAGVTQACHAVLRAVEMGAGLVVLSKFGKLEEGGSGLLHAFGAAAEAGIPCLTGVAPAYAAPFLSFAGEFARWIEPDEQALEAWWYSLRRAAI